jgi:hypothetical protein
LQPSTVFRTALSAGADRERRARTRRPDRVAAVRGLADPDLVGLVAAFEAMLHGRDDVGAMAERLHGTLRALAPDPLLDEGADHA